MDTNIQKPTCVGFILDGNRRWAEAKSLPTFEGHKRGYEVLEETFEWVLEAKIPHLVCYAFSTENWNRSPDEVAYLMELLEMGIGKIHEKQKSRPERVNIRFIGDRSKLGEKLREKMEDVEAHINHDPELTIWIGLSYGGRPEIVQAVNTAIEKGEPVTEESFSTLLWTNGMPDPDLIIRTSGEQRLSNFLPWQSVYSEFFFTETLWPDFSKAEFQSIVEAYGKRKRRNGK